MTKKKEDNVEVINAFQRCQTINEALAKFQDLNISALMNKNNGYFKSTYADLTSVIDAVNHGARFGLSFSQAVEYKNIKREVKSIRKDDKGNIQETYTTDIVKDIYVTTTMFHDIDTSTKTCCVPVLINSNEKDNPHKMGSGITYAKRYGLQSLYGLASDDDGNEASKNKQGKVPNAKNPSGGQQENVDITHKMEIL